MSETIREICMLSIVCGVVCSVVPESPVKTVMGILTAVILMLTVLKPLAEIDLSVYAASAAKYHEMEKQLSIEGEDMSARLNRMVIEDEYIAYIKDKAALLGVNLNNVELDMNWNTKGYWMPTGVQMEIGAGADRLPQLQGIIESQLGISREKQQCSLVQ